MKDLPLEELDFSVFAQWVNASFLVRTETGETLELVLAEARPAPEAGPATAPATSFSLIFHGPDRLLLPQAIRTLEREGVGRFALFLVPIGRRPGRFEYQAVFNRAG